MVYVIVHHGYSTYESFGNEEYEPPIGYTDTEQEAKDYIEKTLKDITRTRHDSQLYPSFSIQEIKKLS